MLSTYVLLGPGSRKSSFHLFYIFDLLINFFCTYYMVLTLNMLLVCFKPLRLKLPVRLFRVCCMMISPEIWTNCGPWNVEWNFITDNKLLAISLILNKSNTITMITAIHIQFIWKNWKPTLGNYCTTHSLIM